MKHLFLLFLATTLSYSQSISKQVIGAAGKTQSNSNLKVSWTIGEPVVVLMTSSRNQLANGYHSALNLQVLSVEDNSLEAQIKVYPNPSSQSIYIFHPVLNSFEIQIVDLNGKKVFEGEIRKEQPIEVSNYPPGMYLLTVENKVTRQKNTYKIIKE